MNASAPFYSIMNPTSAKTDLKMMMKQQQEDEDDAAEREFEAAAAAAEAKRRGRSPTPASMSGGAASPAPDQQRPALPGRGRSGGSARLAKLRGGSADSSPKSPQRTRSPMRARSPVRATSSSAELQSMAESLRKARHSTGGSGGGSKNISRSMSPKRGPRRVKSGGDIHEPAHRSLSPCRSCLSPAPNRKKGMRRQVSFGSKCYEEIPKAAEEEKNDIWYDKTELKDLRKKVKKLAKKGVDQDEAEDCYRGLEPYVKQYQKRKSDDGSLTEQQKCNQILLELTEIETTQEKRRSEELSRMAQDFLARFADQSAKTAAQDEAEAKAIYMESGIDVDQVSKCFQQPTLARGA